MSDKNFVPASGENFLLRKSPLGWKMPSGKEISIDADRFKIDHQTQRLLWTKSETERRLFWIYESGAKRVVSWPGGSITLDSVDLTEGAASGGGKLKPLKLTMPGKVVDVKVKEGQIVEAEQGLVIVEAMKMENLLLAPARAKIGKVHVNVGDRMESGAILITFESAE